jgi:hypothetical protein
MDKVQKHNSFNPKLEAHPLFEVRGYLLHSQLPSTSGGRLLHPQPEDVPCRGDMGHLTWLSNLEEVMPRFSPIF